MNTIRDRYILPSVFKRYINSHAKFFSITCHRSGSRQKEYL